MHLLIKIDENQPEDIKVYLKDTYSSYTKKFPTDSGIDLVVPKEYIIGAHQTTQINLGVCCAVVSDHPHGYYLYPRSSLAKTSLRLANSVGVIDYLYRGPLIATVDNIGGSDEVVHTGIKLFQVCSPDLTPITFEVVDSLDWTERGCGAFGSTGGTIEPVTPF